MREGSGEWSRWLTETTQTKADFPGEDGKQYTFRVQGVDRVGNAGAWLETAAVTTNAVTKYYNMAGQRVAMRQGSAVYYLYGDHLGSTSLVTDAAGATLTETRYQPYGQMNWQWGATQTDYGFTGQRLDGFGLMDYNARYYSSTLGRFVSPDTIIPQPGNPLAWDRYSYSYNNPIVNNDPTGHFPDFVLDLAFIAMDIYFIQAEGWTPNNTVALCADIAFALVPGLTGAGPALQVASRGAKAAAVAYAQAAVHLPAWARFGQAGVKLIQAIDGTAGDGLGLNEKSNFTGSGNIGGITPPNTHYGLRRAIINSGKNAPADMIRPNVHHDLPWAFKDWFAGEGRGLNVNDPQFGRWVEGSKHQNWSATYNQRWKSFIQNNPNATRQDVLEYLDELLTSGDFPSQ